MAGVGFYILVRRNFVFFAFICVSSFCLAQQAPAHRAASPSTAENLFGPSTTFATYAKIPLVEGHGSYFEKSIAMQDPISKKEIEHDKATLEILRNVSSSSVLECGNLAMAWASVPEKLNRGEPVCSNSDFLVKVWPTSDNQAKAYSCYCVSKVTYRANGLAADKVKGFARPAERQNLSLIPLTRDVKAYRPDGSLVEPRRLDGVYAQDLGPGPVNLNTGSRMRYMRFFTKNSRGEFVPISKSEDPIYQVLDSGIVASDIPTTPLARRGVLRRADGSGVTVDRVSTDMWMRPRYIDPASGEVVIGSLVHTSRNGQQTALNSNLYSVPAQMMQENFGLMSRMRGAENWSSFASGRVGTAVSSNQVIRTPPQSQRPRPARSNLINTALPIVSDMNTARRVTGYYTHTYGDNYIWARPHIVWNIQEAGRRLREKGIVMGIGNLNRKPLPGGSQTYINTPPSKSHNRGLAVDMRFIASDGMAKQGVVGGPNYDRAKTFEMIKTLIDVDPNIDTIFVEDEVLMSQVRAYLRKKGVRGARVSSTVKPHHHHLHISWKS
jgi:hypothetical protein